MLDSTLTTLQTLKDAEFHALCDEILPRISERYHPLVPHGRNEKGDSIRGQPDSYVGNTAQSCRIAIQYTVQKKSWWSKAIKDIEVANEACPNAEEIVIVLPVDVDREKPTKGRGCSWNNDALMAAEPKKLTIFHGPTLAQKLNTTCQDLRFHYLGIPFSRLTRSALVAASHKTSKSTLLRLKSLGRYDPYRYVMREADNHFFRLWQSSLQNASGRSGSLERRTLIPLVADSGIGKTSLLAHFIERSSAHMPMLFLLARDLSFDSNDSLIAQVMHSLQGSMDKSLQNHEENHLATKLSENSPLTVVLDGLDETTNVQGVRRSISTWLWSRLGKSSVLVVSSRPEFWRQCRETTWSYSILHDDDPPKVAKSLRRERGLTTLDPMRGIELPGKFTKNELSDAWCQGGRNEIEFWQLPHDVRKELTHPFTMRSALDLLATGYFLEKLRTRSAILSLWIKNRLKIEADNFDRITEYQFQDCLRTIAKIADLSEGSWVVVDNLEAVPRFSASNPPGVVVERLISANILETHLERNDLIRFSFEVIHDYFLAESMIAEIETDPESMANEFSQLSFSNAVDRLERIGDQIASQPFREEFVKSLAELDGPKATIVLRSAIEAYSVECRNLVVSKVSHLLTSRMDAERALATELLGRLQCSESNAALEKYWTAHTPNKRLHPIVSNAAISHGISSLIPLVFRTWWFTRESYFIDLHPELLASTQEFRKIFVEYASNYIYLDRHSDNYHRALKVLGYLKDNRAIETIKIGAQDNFPYYYETLYLLAVGSSDALEVYSLLIERYIEARNAGLEREQDEKWMEGITPHANIGNLITPNVEEFIYYLTESEDTRRQIIGRFLALWLGTSERLLELVVKSWDIKGYITTGPYRFGRRLGSKKWLELWDELSTVQHKKTLIRIARDIYDTRIEDILIETLKNPELSGYSVQSLAAMGSQRACPAIRKLLDLDYVDNKDWPRDMAFRALCDLRDSTSIEVIAHLLESREDFSTFDGTIRLASIGTEEAKKALLELKNQSDEELAKGLLHFGSRECIEKAIEIAKKHSSEDAVSWLLKQTTYGIRGSKRVGRHIFRTDVDLAPLLDFVLSNDISIEIYKTLCSIFSHVDCSSVRKVLRKWYDLRNTEDDLILDSPKETSLSAIAFRELSNRGDEYVLSEFLAKEIERNSNYQDRSWLLECLSFFNRDKLKDTLRTFLKTESNAQNLTVIIDLVGYVGDATFVDELNNLIISDIDNVANAAFEAKLRLSDPLQLLKQW